MLQQCLKWKSAFLFRFNFSVVFLTALTVNGVYAETFPLPQPGEDLIGQIRPTKAHQEDTLIDIARRFSVGQDEMMMANSNVDRWLPREGTDVLIPQEYILPDAPHSGVVVNIPEMRLYYFPVKVAPPSVKKHRSQRPKRQWVKSNRMVLGLKQKARRFQWFLLNMLWLPPLRLHRLYKRQTP